jgi:hypothetical protein
MGVFDEEVALAKELIEENGQAIIIRRTGQAAAPDVDQPWKLGAPTDTDAPTLGVFLDYNRKEIDGEVIKQGDQKVLVPAQGLTIVPAVDDVLLRGAEIWSIINVNELNPNGQRILYTLQVRQ